MILTTPQLRKAWAPSRTPKGAVFNDSYAALDTVLKAWDYRVREDTWTVAYRAITAGAGDSLHAFGPGDEFTFWTGVTRPTALAVDINSETNPYSGKGRNQLITDMPKGMVDDVLKIRTNSGAQVFGSGRYYESIKDPMHFEHVCTPDELATGIDWSTVKGHHQEEDDMTPEQAQLLADTARKVDVLYDQLIGTKDDAPRESLRQLLRETGTDAGAVEKRTRPHK